MNAAKLREYYQQTQLLLSELQALGGDTYGVDRANAKHQQLTRLALQLRNGTEAIAEKDLRAIWEERSAKLHEDLVALTALRLQRDDQSGEQFWDGCVRLLYTGAAMFLQRESEATALQAELNAQKEELTKLQETVQNITQQREAAAKETLELRTRVVVQQQDIQRRDADARNLQQQWQSAVRERDALRLEKDKILQESVRNAQMSERQAQVIGQMMERSESSLKERDEAVSTLKQVDEDNHVLRVNLHQNSMVIEKLINLNTELMEAANRKEQLREAAERRAKQLWHEPLEDKTAEYSADDHPASSDLSEEDDVPVSMAPQEEELPLAHHPVPNQKLTTWRSGESPWGTLQSSRELRQGDAALPGSVPAEKAHSNGEIDEPESGRGAALQEEIVKGKVHPKDQAEVDREPQGKRKQITWTSDMLPVKTKPPQVHGDGNSGETTMNGIPPASGSTGGARSLLRSVGGKAKGFLSYVAGADKVG